MLFFGHHLGLFFFLNFVCVFLWKSFESVFFGILFVVFFEFFWESFFVGILFVLFFGFFLGILFCCDFVCVVLCKLFGNPFLLGCCLCFSLEIILGLF